MKKVISLGAWENYKICLTCSCDGQTFFIVRHKSRRKYKCTDCGSYVNPPKAIKAKIFKLGRGIK